jgi:hypothetical protein
MPRTKLPARPWMPGKRGGSAEGWLKAGNQWRGTRAYGQHLAGGRLLLSGEQGTDQQAVQLPSSTRTQQPCCCMLGGNAAPSPRFSP